MQEYCPGYGVGVEVLMRGGEPVMLFQHRHIREFPISGGVKQLLREHGARFPTSRLVGGASPNHALGWRRHGGVAQGRRSGRVALMEVNGRFWGSIPLAVQAGCDFRYELYRTSIEPGRPVASVPYKTGMRCRLLVAETKWLVEALRTSS